MLSFLLWNIGNKPIQDKIVNLALLYELDIIILIESSIAPAVILTSLNKDGISNYHYAPSFGCKRVDIFTGFSSNFLTPLLETDRLTIRSLALPGLVDILLAVTHFPSKLYWDEASQGIQCVELSKIIKDAEHQIGHSRTVLVGDFNMNPFEDGVVSASGLHSVMTRNIAQKGTRIVQATKHPFFYNPMWGFFGDNKPGPPGTYYYESSVQKVFFWNIFDQVLIRPDLLPLFDNDNIKILESDGETSLLSNSGIPDSKNASDHLPILFHLRL